MFSMNLILWDTVVLSSNLGWVAWCRVLLNNSDGFAERSDAFPTSLTM